MRKIIEYSDLLETLKTEVNADIESNPDYMENKSTAFRLAIMYQKANPLGTIHNTLFVTDGDIIETAFTNAKNKIDELKTK
jgi:hypothetical protein